MNFSDYKKLVVADRRLSQDEIDAIEVVAQLTRIRKRKRMTQGELAEKIGMQQNQISRFENLKASPSMETIMRISKGLNAKIVFVEQDEESQEHQEHIVDREDQREKINI